MSAHDARLAPAAALSLIACALLGEGIGAWWLTTTLAVIAGIAAVWASGRGTAARHAAVRDGALAVATAASIAALLCAGALVREHVEWGGLDPERVAAGHAMEIHGVIVNEPKPALPDRFSGDPRWRASVAATRIDGVPVNLAVDIVLDDPGGIAHGDSVTVRGRWSDTPNPAVAGVIWDARVEVLARGSALDGAIHRSREQLRAAAAPLPEHLEGLTVGMVIGDDSLMPQSQVTDMRRSGLAHLTAVSGAHFAILAVLVQWLTRRWKWPRLLQAAALAVAMIAFAALTGAEPSVIRALAMGLIIAVAISWGRPARALATLSASVVVLLAVDPLLATAVGFQLSVLAVAGIVIWSPHLAVRFSRAVTPTLARALAIPTAATLATLPLMVGIAGGTGLYSVPANVVAGAAAGPVTVLGLMAVVVAWASPAFAAVVVQGAGAAARPVEWAARAFSDAPGAWLDWPAAPWGALLAIAVVACIFAATTSRRVRGWWRVAALLGILALTASAPAFSALRAPRLPHWDVVVCDVGQGDMMMLRSGPHSAVVIDTGPAGGGGAQCLERFGVRTIDLLVLSHPHADHEGAVAELAAAAPISRAWVSPIAAHDQAATRLSSAGVHVEVAAAPLTAEIGHVRLRVLHPSPEWPVGGGDDALNDASIVLLADAGGTTVLALGDLETAGQAALRSAIGGPMVVDVVKVAHHGSATQDAELAELITARVGVISVGSENTYGHPAQSTHALYQGRVQVLLRTDECTDIAMATENGFSVATRCTATVAG